MKLKKASKPPLTTVTNCHRMPTSMKKLNGSSMDSDILRFNNTEIGIAKTYIYCITIGRIDIGAARTPRILDAVITKYTIFKKGRSKKSFHVKFILYACEILSPKTLATLSSSYVSKTPQLIHMRF